MCLSDIKYAFKIFIKCEMQFILKDSHSQQGLTGRESHSTYFQIMLCLKYGTYTLITLSYDIIYAIYLK